MTFDRVKCPQCGEEHDLSRIEPTFNKPDAWFGIPADQHATLTWEAGGACMIRETESAPWRHFLKVTLPIPVRGESRIYNWAVWVEVPAKSFRVAIERWEDPGQSAEPPFHGSLANKLPDMPPTLGLPGAVQLTGPSSIPKFALDASTDHPFVREQRDGVFPERLVEWSTRAVHGGDDRREPAA